MVNHGLVEIIRQGRRPLLNVSFYLAAVRRY